jgi:hypothetical protein
MRRLLTRAVRRQEVNTHKYAARKSVLSKNDLIVTVHLVTVHAVIGITTTRPFDHTTLRPLCKERLALKRNDFILLFIGFMLCTRK